MLGNSLPFLREITKQHDVMGDTVMMDHHFENFIEEWNLTSSAEGFMCFEGLRVWGGVG